MFSLIYCESNKFGVLDNKFMRFHILNKESFDMMVYSAKEEGVEIRGVSFNEDGSFSYCAVAFEDKPNIFNMIPYIKYFDRKISSNQVLDLYSGCFTSLLSLSRGISGVSTIDICKKLGILAYLHLIVEAKYRFSSQVINEVVYDICSNYEDMYEILCKEPNPDDVMEKFRDYNIIEEV